MSTHTSTSDTAPAETAPADDLPPVVVDLGRIRGKYIRQLKDGEGKLMDDVAHTLAAVRSNLGAEVEGKVLVPVVIVYQKRTTRKRSLLPFAF